jgi:ribonuclease R
MSNWSSMARQSKNNKRKDPNYHLEAAKYANPIPSRDFILALIEATGLPMNYTELCESLPIEGEEQLEALRRRLRAMEREGQLLRNRKGAYGLAEKMDLVRGKVQGHADGFGFLLPDDDSGDLYLSARQMRQVFHGDEVFARVSGVDRRGRREGTIVEVLQRNTQEVVGRCYFDQGAALLIPDNSRLGHEIILPASETGKARHGQYVNVEIIQQPGWRSRPTGRVIEVLGDHLAPGIEIEVAIRSHEIPHTWSRAVIREAKRFGKEPAAEDKQKRIDLRDLPFVTIDGEDARDFDDAVCCEAKKSGGWRLLVAIADVSHYVQLHSALDEEAIKRGNSVYFPNHVIPMLPEVLSNGLCSLNPKVDRLAMVCEMSISAQGKMSRYKFYEGVICSHARLTYTQVGRLLADKSADHGISTELAPSVQKLHDLYAALHGARQARGAIDFDTVETRILFDAQRKIEAIVPVQRNDAHRLIEECMLCANVAAARFLEKHKLPGVYRVHQGPNPDKLTNLKAYLGEAGEYLAGGDEPTPADYQALLQRVQNRPDANVIQTVMLRSLSQAVYQPENEGHFGLNYPAYAHFTSPIRRYPDLLTHRAIRYLIRSRDPSNHVDRVRGAKRLARKAIFPYETADMLQFGEHCSMSERRADDATRDVEAWLKCEYLQAHIGDVFEGVITAATNFGVFVELIDIYVEGLVHISSLKKDYYHFDAARHRLLGERTRQSYALGDQITVRVVRVDLEDRKVDLELVDSVSTKKGAGINKAGRKRKVAAKTAAKNKKPAKGKHLTKSKIKSKTKKTKTNTAEKKSVKKVGKKVMRKGKKQPGKQ